MAKRGRWINYFLYFTLLALLLVMLALSAFGVVKMDTGFFTRYLVALVFVLMLLPMVPKVKIFDVVDISRGSRILSAQGRKKRK